MSGLSDPIKTTQDFIALAKEIAKLPALVLPQYKPAAKGFYDISMNLLKGNEKLSSWLHEFRYFDFRNSDARSEFLKICKRYEPMKSGGELSQLKARCRDLQVIYDLNISDKIGCWFSNQQKLEQAEGIFKKLTTMDGEMVQFIMDEVIKRIDGFIDEVEDEVNQSNMDRAEELRLIFKSDTKEIAQHLEKFSGDLTDLVINFAKIAEVPVTLGT